MTSLTLSVNDTPVAAPCEHHNREIVSVREENTTVAQIHYVTERCKDCGADVSGWPSWRKVYFI